MLKIYGRTNSVNVQKVMWAVAELGLPHERIDAGMNFGKVGEDWYGELNPNRRVPTINDDGVILWESNAVVRYLAAKHARGTLMPADVVGQARADMWMDWQQTTLMNGLTPVFHGLIRTPPEKRDLQSIAANEALILPALAMLDRQLQGRAFMLGTNFTVADIPVGAAAHRWYALPIAHPEMPNLRGWYERLCQRPGYKAHVMLPLS